MKHNVALGNQSSRSTLTITWQAPLLILCAWSLTRPAVGADLSLQSAPPVVVKTAPAAGSIEVDPGLTEIRVTFSKPMQDGTWSWSTWGQENFPEITGKIHYLPDNRTCVLPVKLQPGKFYATWLNSDKFKNFMDSEERPAVPYLLTFVTAPASSPETGEGGKPHRSPAAWLENEGIDLNKVDLTAAPATQVMIENLQPDGTSRFLSVLRFVIEGSEPLDKIQFMNSDIVEVQRLVDADGNTIPFTATHRDQHFYYHAALKKPVPAGGTLFYGTEGIVRNKVDEGPEPGMFSYQFTHTPSSGVPTRRVEVHRLPPGAKLLEVSNNASQRVRDGRTEVLIDEVVPPSGSVSLSYRYRLNGRHSGSPGPVDGSAGGFGGGAGTTTQPTAPQPVPGLDQAIVLHRDDGIQTGVESIGGSGHLVEFERPQNLRYIEAVQIFASRYGTPTPPKENFHLYILNDRQQVLADVAIPYATIERADLKWYTLRTPSIEVPEKFGVALAFNPNQTKGIYLGYSATNGQSCYSRIGLPGDGFEKWKPFEWMVRPSLTAEPSKAKGIQRLADWKAPVAHDALAGCRIVSFGGDRSDDMESYGGQGPAIRFKPAEVLADAPPGGPLKLKGVRLFASRYGTGYPPESTTMKVQVLDAKGKELGTASFAYAQFGYKVSWVDLVFDQPIVLKQSDEPVTIVFDPEATKYKGVYFHYQKNPPVSHSLVGKTGETFRELPKQEWLMKLGFETAGK